MNAERERYVNGLSDLAGETIALCMAGVDAGVAPLRALASLRNEQGQDDEACQRLVRPKGPLTPLAARALDAMPGTVRTVARRMGMSDARGVHAVLQALVVRGLATGVSGGVYRRKGEDERCA